VIEQFLPIGGLSDYVDVRFDREQFSQPVPHDGVVIGDHYPDFGRPLP
jgi:hypothetical protein